jgi:hypothetical protein
MRCRRSCVSWVRSKHEKQNRNHTSRWILFVEVSLKAEVMSDTRPVTCIAIDLASERAQECYLRQELARVLDDDSEDNIDRHVRFLAWRS